MAFVVEDGTGLANANSYASLAEFKAYHDDRGNSYAGFADSAIQFALVKATDYIDRRFGRAFLGKKEFPDTPQALEFPRLNLWDRDGKQVTGVPKKLKSATSEYAMRALTADLWPDPTYDAGGALKRKLERVGPIETEVEYTGGDVTTLRAYPEADNLLREYTFPTGFVTR